MKKAKTEVQIINVTEQQRFVDDPAKRLEILEEEINKRLNHLEFHMTNTIGTRFTAEIMNVQVINVNMAMITMRTRQS